MDRLRQRAAMRRGRNGLGSARCDGRVKIRCMSGALRIYDETSLRGAQTLAKRHTPVSLTEVGVAHKFVKGKQAYAKRDGSPKRVTSRAVFYEVLVLQRPTELTRHGNEELQTVRTKIGLKKSVCDVSRKSRSSKRDKSGAHL